MAADAAGTVVRRVLAQLDGPRFAVRASSVSLLDSPAAFYTALVDGVRSSRRRVRLSALYVGTAALERALADELLAAAARGSAERPPPRVSVLLDRMRACRAVGGLHGDACSLDVLAPLVRARPPAGVGVGGGAEVRLFHPPALTGLALLLPPRLIEAVSVQHCKLAVLDDSVLLTGANLSHEYFTSRQDRWLLLRDEPHVADFFDALLDAVGDCSYRVRARAATPGVASGEAWARRLGLDLEPPRAMPVAGRASMAAAGAALAARLERVFAGAERASRVDAGTERGARDGGTWLLPTAQLGSAGLRAEERLLLPLLRLAAAPTERGGGGCLTLSSPYLNLTAPALDALSGRAPGAPGARARGSACHNGRGGRVTLLTAGAASHGFARARGLARHVPAAYSLLEARALRRLVQARSDGGGAEPRAPRASLWRWARSSWTYHAKGVWYAPPAAARARGGTPSDERPPVLTLIGSSNFGARSAERDLECGALLVTTDARLRSRLAGELRALRADARECSVAEAEATARALSPAFRWLVGRWLAPFL
ncbi:hypothetical protein KFE25_012705 [Diacronema lutheri]|uniref:CDP-diacylglycerol--glycerol-3-phosphate 3-phosphatidyltransferase n=1 Tax=Diacronema lutheri TaxID=2081491 RepID=A0A8J6C493_DIALT|nr:hypothetical protein KFE25_012705 [Diacronema lutheri]